MRKFVAATSREALRQVRETLGEHAVILSNRQTPDGVEIVAITEAEMASLVRMRRQQNEPVPTVKPKPDWAAPPKAATAPTSAATRLRPQEMFPQVDANGAEIPLRAGPAPARPAVSTDQLSQLRSEVFREIHNIKDSIEAQIDRLVQAMPGTQANAAASVARPGPASGLAASAGLLGEDPLVQELRAIGFTDAVLRRLLQGLLTVEGRPVGGHNAALEGFIQALARQLPVASGADSPIARGGVYAIVGPTGVGKTTTTAKIAARCVLQRGAQSVALLTTDTYRIGAYEQLRIYGRILGVPVHAVSDEGQLASALEQVGNRHLVLIDTIGMSQRDHRVAEQTSLLMGGGRPVERLLLLNAGAGRRVLLDTLRTYAGEGGDAVSGCILTKLDEAADSLAEVLAVLLTQPLPIHFVTDGQRVPEDLHPPSAEKLARRALEALTDPARRLTLTAA